MSAYATRIATLKSEQAKLAQRQSELAAQRREEISQLAPEKLGVLETDDDVLAGVFLELRSAIGSDSSRLKQLRDAGCGFRCFKV